MLSSISDRRLSPKHFSSCHPWPGENFTIWNDNLNQKFCSNILFFSVPFQPPTSRRVYFPHESRVRSVGVTAQKHSSVKLLVVFQSLIDVFSFDWIRSRRNIFQHEVFFIWWRRNVPRKLLKRMRLICCGDYTGVYRRCPELPLPIFVQNNRVGYFKGKWAIKSTRFALLMNWGIPKRSSPTAIRTISQQNVDQALNDGG